MPIGSLSEFARDPAVLAEFRARVERRDWVAARRLGLALQLHRVEPQRLMERDDVYFRRLARGLARFKTSARAGRIAR